MDNNLWRISVGFAVKTQKNKRPKMNERQENIVERSINKRKLDKLLAGVRQKLRNS